MLRFLVKLLVGVWFLALLLLPIYGLICPWPQAIERLAVEGIRGIPLMIGGGGSSERSVTPAGETWRKERQRSFFVIPDSFQRLELFTYSETSGSKIEDMRRTVTRSRWLIPLLGSWILAGVFTIRSLRSSKKKEPNQSLQPTAPSGRG